jgi:hypothetical protein
MPDVSLSCDARDRRYGDAASALRLARAVSSFSAIRLSPQYGERAAAAAAMLIFADLSFYFLAAADAYAIFAIRLIAVAISDIAFAIFAISMPCHYSLPLLPPFHYLLSFHYLFAFFAFLLLRRHFQLSLFDYCFDAHFAFR